jgi:hypothetical protein
VRPEVGKIFYLHEGPIMLTMVPYSMWEVFGD